MVRSTRVPARALTNSSLGIRPQPRFAASSVLTGELVKSPFLDKHDAETAISHGDRHS
jgi:hypothetical protein